jgi:polysaccharide export outer membrane protein
MVKVYTLVATVCSLLLSIGTGAADLSPSDTLHVVVNGEVLTPGDYAVPATTPINSLLTQAGGLTQRAADSLYIERADESGQVKRYSISLSDPLRLGETHLLQEGDKLIIPRAVEYSVAGEVQKPGSYRLDSSLTVQEAITKAGGVTLWAKNRRNFQIQRKDADGRRMVVKVNPDDFVEPDDVILVKGRYF